MQEIEDAFVSECRKQGLQPASGAMIAAAVDLAGSVMTDDGLMVLPGKGSLRPGDYVRTLRDRMPEAFGRLNDQSNDRPAGNLTERMRVEVAAGRERRLPSDWDSVRKRYAAGSTTAAMMDEIEASRRAGK